MAPTRVARAPDDRARRCVHDQTSEPIAPSRTTPTCSGKTAPGRKPSQRQSGSPSSARPASVDRRALRDRHDGADAGQEMESRSARARRRTPNGTSA